MSHQNSCSLLILILPLLFLFISDSASSSCQAKCGEMEIPYPFGIGAGCYLDERYAIQCVNSTTFLSVLDQEVVDIILPREATYAQYASLHIKSPITSKGCSREDKEESLFNLTGTPFYVGYRNTLVAVGCNFTASLTTVERSTVKCSSSCGPTRLLHTPTQNYLAYVSCETKGWKRGWENYPQCDARSIKNETICDGIGCCQTSIPDELQQVVGVRIDENITSSTRGCKVAFLTDQTYSFKHRSDPERFHAKGYATLELGWFFLTTNLSFIDSLGCNTNGQSGVYSDRRADCTCNIFANSSYADCYCRYGYGGNPYVVGGCKVFSGCRLCTLKGALSFVFVIAFGCLIFIGGVYLLSKCIKRQKRIKRKKKFFKRNGGLLLQQQLTSTDGNVEKTKIFSTKELKKATENFSITRVLGQGGQGTVYKGMLVDGGIVAVKKSKAVDEDKLEEFINEVVILSQINHRNIVKLLGCCLETEVPVLVYEFIPNGNLFQHLHDEFDDYTMATWEVRLRIAVDVAGALSYLHSAASFPIYHRDVKSTNIMLDEKYRAKVSDFGTSRSVTVDHTHLTTVVSGTVGYLDPEYFQSSQFTDKSDVYSFGVVLVELITGEKPVSFLRSQENRTLANCFILAMKENRLDEIIDARIKEECKLEQVKAVAKLARKCLNRKGRIRPTMREVSMELERLRSSHGDPLPQGDVIESDEEEEETMEVNIKVESWNNVAVTDNGATSFLDAEPLFPRQTW